MKRNNLQILILFFSIINFTFLDASEKDAKSYDPIYPFTADSTSDKKSDVKNTIAISKKSAFISLESFKKTTAKPTESTTYFSETGFSDMSESDDDDGDFAASKKAESKHTNTPTEKSSLDSYRDSPEEFSIEEV